jgi:predicted NBD/HSP70 family sugar kinase
MQDYTIIGIDGGATKLTGGILIQNKETKTFSLSTYCTSINYSDYPEFDHNFEPEPIDHQLEAWKHNNVVLTDHEKSQGKVYEQALYDVITTLMDHFPGQTALVGIGMPGLKTTNLKGIAVLANGPRMPEFLARVEKKLTKNGYPLLRAVHKLGSDADYCGMGEEYADAGSFRPCKNAYYLGGGTGVADALKINGQLLPFDKAKDWIAKTWELTTESAESFERYVSARGIQRLYSRLSGLPIQALDKFEIYGPEILQRAINGEPAATATLEAIAKNLSKLIVSRITTLYSGWQNDFKFVNRLKKLNPEHSCKGSLLDAIVIGQRLGDLLKLSMSTPFLYPMLVDNMSAKLLELDNDLINQHYLMDDKFNEDLIKISRLREAPIIGAGVDAFLNHNQE